MRTRVRLCFFYYEAQLVRVLSRFALVLVVTLASIGCSGDQKGVNQNKDKPVPAAK